MDARIMRSLIYLFSGLIVIFALLMAVNYLGSRSGGSYTLPGQEGSGSGLSEEDAPKVMAAARYDAATGGVSTTVPPRQGLSTAAAVTEGAIQVVKEQDFNGVAEKPKGVMEMLNEMGGGDKRKPAPIRLSDADLDKKVRPLGGKDAQKLKSSVMPEMGRGAGQEGTTLYAAQVDYKLFKSSETWTAFAASRKVRSSAGGKAFSAPDFSREHVVVLVSLSELPNGIFRIVKAEKAGKELIVSYKVDPMAMAAASDEDQHDFYSAAAVPKGFKIKLQQVP